jgi:hypothetical protein
MRSFVIHIGNPKQHARINSSLLSSLIRLGYLCLPKAFSTQIKDLCCAFLFLANFHKLIRFAHLIINLVCFLKQAPNTGSFYNQPLRGACFAVS